MRLSQLVFNLSFAVLATKSYAAPVCEQLFSNDSNRTDIALRGHELKEFYRESLWGVPDIATYDRANSAEISTLKPAAVPVRADIHRAHYRPWSDFSTVLTPRSATTVGLLAILKSATNRQMLVDGQTRRLRETPVGEVYLTKKDYESLYSLGEPRSADESAANERTLSTQASTATRRTQPGGGFARDPYQVGARLNAAGTLVRAHSDAMFAKFGAAQAQIGSSFTRERVARDGDFRIDFGNGQSMRIPMFSPWASFFPSANSVGGSRSNRSTTPTRSIELTRESAPVRRRLFSPNASFADWFRYASTFELGQALRTMKIPIETETSGAIRDREGLLQFVRHLTGQNGQRDPKAILVQFKASIFEVTNTDGYGSYRHLLAEPNPRSTNEAYGLVLGLKPGATADGPAVLQVLVAPNELRAGHIVELPADSAFFESLTQTFYLGVKPETL